FAAIQFTQNGVLVSEAAEGATAPIQSGRVFAEVGGSVNTAVAFVNPTPSPVVVSFHFTNLAGRDISQGNFTINANSQIARFLNEAPFGLTSFTGTFTFEAALPIAVAAFRTFVNERSEFLLTAEPVAPLPATASAGTILLPHFVDGAGWSSQVVIVNPTDFTITGTVQFFDEGSATADASPLP